MGLAPGSPDGELQVRNLGVGRPALEQIAELLFGEARVTNNTTERERIYRIVAWDRENTMSVTHHRVLALPNDHKTRFFQCAYRIEVVDPRDLTQRSDHDLDFANILAL